jgi:hypothetical protein
MKQNEEKEYSEDNSYDNGDEDEEQLCENFVNF